MTTTPEQAAAEPPARNTPRIAEFEVDDGTPIIFIFVEQSVLCPASSFCKAVFYWFSAHYVFNLEYSKNLKEFGLYFSRVCVWTSWQLQENCNIFGCHHWHSETHHILMYTLLVITMAFIFCMCLWSPRNFDINMWLWGIQYHQFSVFQYICC